MSQKVPSEKCVRPNGRHPARLPGDGIRQSRISTAMRMKEKTIVMKAAPAVEL